MRERLIELFRQIEFDYYEECAFAAECDRCAPDQAKFFADHLLANGVIVCDIPAVEMKKRPLVTQCLGRPLDEIIELVEAKDEGRIVVPPCKVGDTVYVKWRLSRKSNYGIYPAKVYALRWDEKKNNFRVCVEGKFEISAYGGEYTHYYQSTFAWNNVGKTVFLAREQAEEALAKKGEKN